MSDLGAQDTVNVAPVHVSITGLRLKRWWHLPSFLWHATASARQARRASGNLGVHMSKVDGVYHTLTIWRSRADMHRFLSSGAHRRAIDIFPTIAEGMTYGFETTAVPRLDDVHALWLQHGREYGPPQRP